MRTDKLLPYLAVLVLVAGAYFYAEFRHGRQQVHENEAKLVFQVQVKDIKALTLKSDQGEIELRRITEPEKAAAPASESPAGPPPGGWRLTRPVAAPADELTITSLLSGLAELKAARRLEPVQGDKIKEFGLDKPIFSLEFEAGAQSHQLRFGHKAPGEQTIYAQIDEDPRILLIRVSDKETLQRTLTDLRSKKIFSLIPEKVKELRLIRGDGRLIWRQGAAAEWTAENNQQLKLRTDRIQALVGQLTGAKALEFVAEKADDLKKYGLAPSPALRLTLLTEDQEETLLVGGKQGDRYFAQVSGTGPVIQVDQGLVEKLPTAYESLEDRRLWSGPETEVHKVVWGAPDHLLTAVREPNGWNIVNGDKTQPRQESPTKFSLAFWRLRDLEFSRLPAADEVKKGKKPLFTLQLLGQEDKPLFGLEEFGGEKDQVQVIFTHGEKVQGAVIPAKTLTSLKETLGYLAAPAPAK